MLLLFLVNTLNIQNTIAVFCLLGERKRGWHDAGGEVDKFLVDEKNASNMCVYKHHFLVGVCVGV